MNPLLTSIHWSDYLSLMTRDFLEKWFPDVDRRQYSAVGEYFTGAPPKARLEDVLELDVQNCSAFGKDLLSLDHEAKTLTPQLEQLAAGIRAYIQFQDLLDLKLNTSASQDSLLNRHYCYFESLMFLREAGRCLVDGRVLATMALCRPFIEIGVLHLYWKGRGENSFEPYYQWLLGKENRPPFRNALESVITTAKQDGAGPPARLDELQQVLRSLFASSSSFNHIPSHDESFTQFGKGHAPALYSFVYALSSLNIAIRQMILLYAVSYPMSMFPVDGYPRWGFSGPVGLFADHCTHSNVAQYLGNETVSSLQTNFRDTASVKSLMDWFNSLPTLSPIELEVTWKGWSENQDPQHMPQTVGERIAQQKAFLRTTGWGLNYVVPSSLEDSIFDASNPDTLSDFLKNRLGSW